MPTKHTPEEELIEQSHNLYLDGKLIGKVKAMTVTENPYRNLNPHLFPPGSLGEALEHTENRVDIKLWNKE